MSGERTSSRGLIALLITRHPVFSQHLDQLRKRPASVADRILLRRCELRSGAAEVGNQEVGIVTEAVRSARLRDDLAVPTALGDQRLGVVVAMHQRDHAVIVRFAIARSGERLEQLPIVAGVLVFTIEWRGGGRPWRVACRLYPRGTAERIHADA